MEFWRRDLLADGDDDDLVFLSGVGFCLRREEAGVESKERGKEAEEISH